MVNRSPHSLTLTPSSVSVATAFVHPARHISIRTLYDELVASHAATGAAFVAPVPMLPVTKAAPWLLGHKTYVMGIVNVTPDSFSDGADLATVDAAVARALEMARQGVDIIDIGGESSRPGAEPVSLDDELARVLPVIAGIRAASDVPISIDTTKAEVARQAIRAGANVVNDISAGLQDPDMLATVAALRVPVRHSCLWPGADSAVVSQLANTVALLLLPLCLEPCRSS